MGINQMTSVLCACLRTPVLVSILHTLEQLGM